MIYMLDMIYKTNPEPEIILEFVRNTFPVEIKVDQKTSNLIRFFALVLCLCWLNPVKSDFPAKSQIDSPGDYETF